MTIINANTNNAVLYYQYYLFPSAEYGEVNKMTSGYHHTAVKSIKMCAKGKSHFFKWPLMAAHFQSGNSSR